MGMISRMEEAPKDSVVEKLKASRSSVAVLKLTLLKLRSQRPDRPIFVMEGPDDKCIYSQWLRRLKGDIRVEYHVCHGKFQVLGLHESVRNDKTDLAEKIFFFVDRDFDDLAGYTQTESLFMTDRYSVENYLLDPQVIEDILDIELHCNGFNQTKAKILEIFEKAYQEFLLVTQEFNFRLFLSKAVPISREGDFPQRINQIAAVSLANVRKQVREANEVISLTREPSQDEIDAFKPVFDALSPKERYRGKFATLFLNKWLDLLADDHSSDETEYFGDIDRKTRARRHEVVLANLASRSAIPPDLTSFLRSL